MIFVGLTAPIQIKVFQRGSKKKMTFDCGVQLVNQTLSTQEE